MNWVRCWRGAVFFFGRSVGKVAAEISEDDFNRNQGKLFGREAVVFGGELLVPILCRFSCKAAKL